MMRSIIESGAVKSSKEMWECYHNYIKKNEHMYKPAKSATPAIKNHLVEKLAPKKEKIIEETEEEKYEKLTLQEKVIKYVTEFDIN